MNDLLFRDIHQPRGFRLSKVELYNWGTFDGNVHGFHPRGESALLVGENGTGKSTLVDALLTLLVRPNARKYNFASGANKSERDEKTYIQGAFDKTVDSGGTPRLKYLRPGSGHYSALLASFENQQTGKRFTCCQVLYLDSNNKAKKFYAFDPQQERGIAEDLGKITEGSSVLATLKKRDFKATDSYTQYFDWLKRATTCRSKAMDMFNQAAFVKDVERLDSFVRDQMLEKKPWDEKVSKLLEHFAELNEAHRVLVNVRDQGKFLEPIMQTGKRYSKADALMNEAKAQLEAASLYFRDSTRKLLAPFCRQWESRLKIVGGDLAQVEDKMDQSIGEVERIRLEIAGAGGLRMQQLPSLIKQEEEIAAIKQKNRSVFEVLLQNAGLEQAVESADELSALLATVTENQTEQRRAREQTQSQSNSLQYELGQLKRQISNDKSELESLQKRKGNMPRDLVFMRDEICRELKISAKDLPFSAELIAVDSGFREWEASIEQVLNSFGRDLLVTEKHYAKVSGFVDRNRLVDQSGRGKRLTYTRVGQLSEDRNEDNGGFRSESATAKSSVSGANRRLTLAMMLKFRDQHELSPWIRDQVSRRFDFLACDTAEEFQSSRQAAMTRHRHTKRNRNHHNKDDRSSGSERKWFILGWENREKILALKSTIEKSETDAHQLEQADRQLQRSIEAATKTISFLDQVSETDEFDSIDVQRHRVQANQHSLELKKLTNSNDKVRDLESKKAEIEERIRGHKKRRDLLSEEQTRTRDGLSNGQLQIKSCVDVLAIAEADGSLKKCRQQFGAIEALLIDSPLSIENYMTLPQSFQEDRLQEVQRLESKLEPVRKSLQSHMNRFLTRFQQHSDLDVDVDSLPQFVVLNEKIRKDDLPKHENRFKKRLNENVLNEVGVMNSHLESEREEIKRKIEDINEGLLRIEWREETQTQKRTHIRLEPEDTKDREIRAFRLELNGCLAGYLDGSNQANEETFLRIKKLVDQLRDEKNVRWRENVIDVRKWFCFSAQEVVTETGDPGSYYDGGSGKSGGEKARLAFLVLVAAIVYQYDINPDDPKSNKFHFVMVDEMFSRTANKYARYALDLFKQFGLQLLMVAPLDAKARVCEPYVGVHAHVVKDATTNQSEILSYTTEEYEEALVARRTV